MDGDNITAVLVLVLQRRNTEINVLNDIQRVANQSGWTQSANNICDQCLMSNVQSIFYNWL